MLARVADLVNPSGKLFVRRNAADRAEILLALYYYGLLGRRQNGRVPFPVPLFDDAMAKAVP
jgi:hypothetical protein